MTLETEYTVQEVAEAIGMSVRWVRAKLPTTPHQRYGHKIRFTAAQVETLRASHTAQPKPDETANDKRVTTGKKKKA